MGGRINRPALCLKDLVGECLGLVVPGLLPPVTHSGSGELRPSSPGPQRLGPARRRSCRATRPFRFAIRPARCGAFADGAIGLR